MITEINEIIGLVDANGPQCSSGYVISLLNELKSIVREKRKQSRSKVKEPPKPKKWEKIEDVYWRQKSAEKGICPDCGSELEMFPASEYNQELNDYDCNNTKKCTKEDCKYTCALFPHPLSPRIRALIGE